MSANRIYNSITRRDDPAAAVAELDAGELKLLAVLVESLPASGIPLLVGALVDEEIQTRWLGGGERS